MKFLASMLLTIIFFFTSYLQVKAYEIPQFTSCINPQGQTRVSYDSGTHGIAGQIGNYQGKDAVYMLSGDALTQCFCSTNGSGIQTNWWKVSSLTEDEIDLLKSQGWNYVPNGALWGLEEAPYLAFNSNYSCQGSSTGSGSTGGCCSPTTDIPGPGGSGGQGSVLGVSTGSVLGLASTGNTKFIAGIFTSSLLALFIGLILKKRSKKVSR